MTSFSLKDHLFNEEKVAYLSDLLAGGIPGFDGAAFRVAVMSQMPDLELKERIAHIADVMGRMLHGNFEKAAAQIRACLPPPLDPTLGDDDFGDFIIAPFGRFVEERGLDHYETSMSLLREITMRFSTEGSVRPFINRNPERSLRLFRQWATDANYHVRRLVSEGTRPTLPWSPRIVLGVADPIPLLDVLHADPTRYVTRSVANHLNDVSKIDRVLTLLTLERWRDQGRQEPDELAWMSRHALRTLVKRGDPSAMAFLGYSPEPAVTASLVDLTSIVTPGEALEFAVELSASAREAVMVDYTIEFVKMGGGTSPKVFKLKKAELAEGQTTTLEKRHRLRADATTYTLYPGTHRLTVTVNGRPMATGTFELVID